MKSCWELLEIAQTKDIKQIKKAYSTMVKKYHPEDDPLMYQQIRAAYETALQIAKGKFVTQEPVQQDTASDSYRMEEQKPALKANASPSFQTQVYAEVFDEMDHQQQAFLEGWKKLLQEQASLDAWEQFFKTYKGFAEYVSGIVIEMQDALQNGCSLSKETAVYLRVRLALYQIAESDSLDEQLKNSAMGQVNEKQEVISYIKKHYRFALLHLVFMDWVKVEQSKNRNALTQWQTLFQTISFQLVKTDEDFHQLLLETLDCPKPLPIKIQQAMQKELELSSESKVWRYCSGQCFDMFDFTTLMTKQRAVCDAVLERWQMLSVSTKRNHLETWKRFLTSDAFVNVREDPAFLIQLAKQLQGTKPYRLAVGEYMKKQLLLSSHIEDVYRKQAFGEKTEADMAVLALYKQLSTTKRSERFARVSWICAICIAAIAFCFFQQLPLEQKAKKQRETEVTQERINNLQKANLGIETEDTQTYLLWVNKKEGKKWLMFADEALLEIEDYRHNNGNYRIIKLQDGWHFYDFKNRKVMKEVYDDIFVVKGEDNWKEHYAVGQHATYALLDKRLTMVKPYIYKKADLKDKYYSRGEFIDRKDQN